MSDLSQFLTSPAVARRLGLRPSTLRKWRAEGRGPEFVRLGNPRSGRVLYRVEDVERWMRLATTPGGLRAGKPDNSGIPA